MTQELKKYLEYDAKQKAFVIEKLGKAGDVKLSIQTFDDTHPDIIHNEHYKVVFISMDLMWRLGWINEFLIDEEKGIFRL